jgi:hypothetical protein
MVLAFIERRIKFIEGVPHYWLLFGTLNFKTSYLSF